MGQPKKVTPFRIEGDVAILTVTLNKSETVEVKIDTADLDAVLYYPYSWRASANRRGYAAVRSTRVIDGRFTTITLSRFLLNPPEDLVVDHINHDTLDNRRQNLRIATAHQNTMNRRSSRNSVSQYKGVSYCKAAKDDDKWVASIRSEGTMKYLGRFSTEADAAMAYDQAARRQFGEFALLNFPDVMPPIEPMWRKGDKRKGPPRKSDAPRISAEENAKKQAEKRDFRIKRNESVRAMRDSGATFRQIGLAFGIAFQHAEHICNSFTRSD